MQIASIQILRFVAALAVAVAHLQGDLRRLSLPTLPDGFVIGAVGVDLFFVISGFVIVYSSENLFGRSDAPLYFFLRRAARIWPMYAAFTLAITAHLLYRYGTLEIAGHSWASLAASLAFIPFVNLHGTTTPIYGVGWTLNFEMFFYLLFACLVWLPRLWATTAAATVLLTLVLAGRLEMIPGPYNLLTSTIVLEFAYGALNSVRVLVPGPAATPVSEARAPQQLHGQLLLRREDIARRRRDRVGLLHGLPRARMITGVDLRPASAQERRHLGVLLAALEIRGQREPCAAARRSAAMTAGTSRRGSSIRRHHGAVRRPTAAVTSATRLPCGFRIVTALRNVGMDSIGVGSASTGRTRPAGCPHLCSANLSSVSV